MVRAYTFYPSRRFGFLFHVAGMSLLLMGGAYSLWRVGQAETIPALLVSLLPAAAAVVGVPVLIYRLYALLGAEYVMERDGFRLRWGLRVEHIPSNQVEWFGHSDRLGQSLPYPWLTWPGSVLGVRRLPDGRSLEYLAGRTRNLILIATPQRVFAISPADPGDFELTYLRLTELGSLAPIPARTVKPDLLLASFRSDQTARLMLLGSFVLWLIVLVSVGLGIQGHEQVVLRFSAQSLPTEYAPAVQLFLLPILSALVLLVDALMGLIFYRRVELRSLSYLLWGAGILTTSLFLIAVILILNTI